MPELTTDIYIATDGTRRCSWCGRSELYQRYHDLEWGQPVGEDRDLFEKICLESFQAGLSWLTILRKREAFRQAFAGFDMKSVAQFGDADVARLMANEGIVRNRQKITAAINNAARALEVVEEFGSLAAYIWQYEPDERTLPKKITRDTIPKTNAEATRLAKDMKKRGFRFVGPVMTYALMESMGLVNNHMQECDFRLKIKRARDAFERPKIRENP
ncbi:DNA-3-methyladenine glycosylase I [Bradymonas sediminis]|uniref:DNA-3-methyladenine glycosylase I n=1 Tax=Bradymonas sediminis TaxID=1548548 RepID=A0A2Z4FQS6_9DELT|nr:DNA-3-methyladenine glycosylase I [Bradymonas sediminis]AWV91343.1 DNA-3-methyladenine glycosylase I [Bradymonas sediminis]TDP77619.1 DNA-3-methyladenine glycosylase I [Bradymonas sediminis]